MEPFGQDEIKGEYDRIVSSTLKTWSTNQGTGKDIGLPAGYFDYGISVGSYFEPNTEVCSLIDDLKSLRANDGKHVLIPDGCHHFTFLALATHIYKKDQPLPAEVGELRRICESYFDIDGWQLERLRVVPGPNYLLLVGIPSVDLVNLRQKFANALLDSSWCSHLNSRHEHKGYPFPPRIWHTTLCRYTSEFLSQEGRRLFGKYKELDLGHVELAPPRLRKVTYDWSSAPLIP